MKFFFVDGALKLIKKKKKCNNEELEIIKYGLEGLYLTISKLVIIFIIAFFLKLIKEVIIFLLIYNVIRTFSFGLHATKSWICLISSILIFIGCPLCCKYFYINKIFVVFIGLFLIYLFFKNSPADTKKRPIINKNRRCFFKYFSTFISVIFIIFALIIKDNFLSNCFFISLIIQSFLISPTIYKLFNLPYNNYLNYDI